MSKESAMTESGLELVLRAARFAAHHHRDQRRKGDAGEPYLNHLIEVAHILAAVTGDADPVLIAAGLLHDVVEDQDVTLAEVTTAFGPEIAGIVAEVTDDKSLHKTDRKRLQVEMTPHKSVRARMLKIADKTSNLRAIITSPPVGWSVARKRAYYDWAAAVVAGCRGVCPALEAQFDEAHATGLSVLDAGCGSKHDHD